MLLQEDQIGKLVLLGVLEEHGVTATELEVPALAPQRGDLFYAPWPARRLRAPALALLRDMTAQRSVLEPFSQTPTLQRFTRGCLRKQVQLYHNFALEAERKEGRAPPLQRMWVLSPGRPERLLRAFRCRARRGRWQGFYEAPAGLNLGVVVLAELRKTVETLVLRYLHRGLREEALEQLKSLPQDSADARALWAALTRADYVIKMSPHVSKEEKEGYMTALGLQYERYREELRQTGRQEGKEEGKKEGEELGQRLALRKAIFALCEVLDLPVSAARRSQLAKMDAAALSHLMDQVKTQRAWP